MSYSSLNVDIVVKKGYFGLLGNTRLLVHYPIVSSQKIEVYRVETVDMGKIPLTRCFQWNMKIQSSP